MKRSEIRLAQIRIKNRAKNTDLDLKKKNPLIQKESKNIFKNICATLHTMHFKERIETSALVLTYSGQNNACLRKITAND